MSVELRDAREEMARRLLTLSLREFDREWAEDYRLVKKQRCERVGEHLGYLSSISLGDQRRIGIAQVKRCSEALGIERLDAADRDAIDTLLEGLEHATDVFEPVGLAYRTTTHDREHFKLFRKSLVGEVVSQLSQKPLRGSGVNPYIVKQVGDWQVGIGIDFGAPHEPSARISQLFGRADATVDNVRDAALLRPFRLGLTELLGFGEATWGFEYYENLDEIIEPVLEEIKYMLAPVSKLIEGLDI